MENRDQAHARLKVAIDLPLGAAHLGIDRFDVHILLFAINRADFPTADTQTANRILELKVKLSHLFNTI